MAVVWTILIVMLMSVERTGAASPEIMPTLKSCPSSPNCVSSRATDDRHAIEPFGIYQTAPKTMQALKEVLTAYPRTTLITTADNYIHAEFKVNIGFVDDVEFVIDEAAGLVHMRSASRIGYWDFGTNRRRIEKLRQMYNQLIDKPK
jgi:uncharacterized protein (DUF1499 family)